MRKVKLISCAKINLTLDIEGVREDGYHLVKMVMQSVSLYDVISLEKTGREGELKLFCNMKYLPTDDRNIAVKAAKLFFEAADLKNEGLFINIRKKIPVGAGLAGGSGNAAAVIEGLCALYSKKLSPEQKNALCLSCGSDVPFCLEGGTMLAEGTGEKLTKLPPMSTCSILLAKPKKFVSTQSVYKLYDQMGKKVFPDTDSMIASLTDDCGVIAQKLCNVLEPVTSSLCPEVPHLKEEMERMGALGAAMSGSGPTVFGVFKDEQAALRCGEKIKAMNPDVFVHTVSPCDFGVKIIG